MMQQTLVQALHFACFLYKNTGAMSFSRVTHLTYARTAGQGRDGMDGGGKQSAVSVHAVPNKHSRYSTDFVFVT